LPLLVDMDTGFGPSAFNIERSVKALIKAGAAAAHLEDQAGAKRCGHRPGKAIVSTAEMLDRIKAAVDAKTDGEFFLIARTDAIASEGVDAALERCQRYIEAGADGIFAEAAYDLATYQRFTAELSVPILANITEFGATPLFTRENSPQSVLLCSFIHYRRFAPPIKRQKRLIKAFVKTVIKKMSSNKCKLAPNSISALVITALRTNSMRCFLPRKRIDNEQSRKPGI